MQMDGTPLSEREKEVARVLLQGKSNKQIALELGISNRTVEFHLGNIYSRLGVSSRTEAVLKLRESHLWETPGMDQGESTVDGSGDRNENGLHVIPWRIIMKKLFYGFGILLAAALSGYLVLVNMQEDEVNPTPLVPTPAMSVDLPTVTLPAPTQTFGPAPERVTIPPHTVNGYTAAIESYYVDVSHVIFQVLISGGDLASSKEYLSGRLSGVEIYDEYGNMINSSGGIGPAVDPDLLEVEFVPLKLLKGDRLKGQFAFDLTEGSPNYNIVLASFRFDLDLPIYPEVRFQPKQIVTSNGLELLLDSVTVTPVFTQAYLCFPAPSYAPWTIGRQSKLQIGDQEAVLYNTRTLFSSSAGGDRRAGSEPYWAPPVKNGDCVKIGFQAGSMDPTFITLTIPNLENLMPYVSSKNPFSELPGLYPGLNTKDAVHTYLEENGFTYKGPWVFNISLVP